MYSITGQSVDYAWRQVSPNRWQREIDEAEQFYACLAKSFEASGRMFFAITGFVPVSIPVPPLSSLDEICTRVDSAFRDAWLRLRCEIPTIASEIHFNEEMGLSSRRTMQLCPASINVLQSSSLIPRLSTYSEPQSLYRPQ
ncbi:hypothetical protein C7974DRAFT_375868 [Boeremia exigua]|uniref:uncharacterized protein n=1 Tax=Boeremia exigua TaxID=749465 RepID=UPI001E8E7386|nr:uncharacterized protein C7974DRAFT_375868 [Boeremia exigua]KAH6628972.1 hypothetical protein C7974DRAFT_375868 [Boeremia exigua]